MPRDLLSHLLHSPKPDARKPSTAPATRRAQAQASEAQVGSTRQIVLGYSSWLLVSMEGRTRARPARDRGRWHQAGFKLYWTMLCKVRGRVGGGRRISKQIRQLIFQMVAENPTWGAPRIHGELLMLGFEVSEVTVSRWMRRSPRDPEPARR